MTQPEAKRSQSRAATYLLTALLACSAATGTPEAQRAEASAPCWAFDLHLVTLIEDHGQISIVDPAVLAEAAMGLVDARLVCRAGDTARALAIYETILLGRLPDVPIRSALR